MSVSAISSGGNTAYASATSSSEIQSLQKQISELQKTISEVQADKDMDDETKSRRVAVYQAQISQLQAQISNLQQEQKAAASQGASGQDPAKQFDELQELRQQYEDEGNRATGMFGIGQYIDQDA